MKTLVSCLAVGALAVSVLSATAPHAAQAQERARVVAQQPAPPAKFKALPMGGQQTIPAGPGGIAAQPPAGHVPTFAQLGSTQAKVPMKHGSCGLDCGTHVLAVQSGNLGMQAKIGMTCPAGTSVQHLSYKPQGVNATTVVGASTGSSSYAKTITAKPFSKAELEQACQAALGGSWAQPGHHHNSQPVVKKPIQKSVNVWGQCTGWANKVKRTYPVSLTLSCQDTSFPPKPVP